MDTLPKELKLCVVTFLNGMDIKNFIYTYSIDIVKTDLIFLLNSINPKYTNDIVNKQDPLLYIENKYILAKYINHNLELSSFIKEYISAFHILNLLPKLFYHICEEMLALSVKDNSTEWEALYTCIMNEYLYGGLTEEPFVFFSEGFNIYVLMDILDEYDLLKETEGDFYRDMMSNIDGFDDENHYIRYLKYTYNKWGDQGYITFLLRSNGALKWFLGLDIEDEYKNTYGPVCIVDFEELKDYIEDDFDEDIVLTLHEYINKYQGIDKYVESVDTITELIEYLENQDV